MSHCIPNKDKSTLIIYGYWINLSIEEAVGNMLKYIKISFFVASRPKCSCAGSGLWNTLKADYK